MNFRPLPAVCLVFVLATAAVAQEYKVQKLEEGPPSEGLAPEIAQALESTGLRVMKGQRTVVDLWLRKEWPVKAEFEPSFTVMYPFEVGTLVGVGSGMLVPRLHRNRSGKKSALMVMPHVGQGYGLAATYRF